MESFFRVRRRYGTGKLLLGVAGFIVLSFILLHFLSAPDAIEHKQGSGDKVSQGKRHRVALLVYGVRLETLFQTGKSIMQYVVEETNADVFVYGREVTEYNTSGAVAAAFGDRLRGVFLGPQLEEKEVIALLSLSKRFGELKEVCAGSNLIKPGTLNGLIWGQKTFQLATSYERAHGFHYDYMIFIRPDMEWFAPFPPLSMLDKKHQMWIPTRTTWGGLPASCIVCPRGLCTYWADWWDRFRNGELVAKMKPKGYLTQRNCAMSEIFEWFFWKAADVPVGWWSVIYAVVCAQRLCENGDQCFQGKSICAPGQRYKYDQQESWFEATLAKYNARRIKKNGWQESEFRYNCNITPDIIRKFRADFQRTGKREMLPMLPNTNALHPEPPWSPLDGL